MLNQNSPVQIIDPDGNVKTAKIPDIHNQAILDATQQLYDLAKDLFFLEEEVLMQTKYLILFIMML